MATFGQKLRAATKGEDPDRELILTPMVEERYAREAGASGFSKETAERIAELIADDSNSSRGGRFGASSRGDCLRRQLFSYLGHEQRIPADLSAIFADGHWRHLRWQAMGYEEGWFTEVEVGYRIPEYGVTVSVDAVNEVEGWGFELKGTSNLQGVKDNGVPHKHLLQIHTMMLASKLDTFVYIAEDKRTQAFHEIVVHRDEALMAEVEGELMKLTHAVEAEVLPPVLNDCARRHGPTYRGCPYKTMCLEAEGWPDVRVEVR